MAAELFANNFAVQLTNGCAAADTTIQVSAPAPAGLQGGQFRILIDQEYMLVTGGQSGTTWNVTRGSGTGESPTPTAVAHQSGAWVTHLITAAVLSGLAPQSSAAALQPAMAVATSNVSLSGLQTIDSYALQSGDRVLLTGQSLGAQNGLWIAASGGWTRPSDFASGASISTRPIVNVVHGNVNAGSLWLLSTNPVTVDTTAESWQLQLLPSVANANATGSPLKILIPTGGDDGAALQTLINALGTGGGTILIPGGNTYNWATTPLIPRNLTGPLAFQCHGATIAQTSTSFGFLGFNKVADGDTFRHVRVYGLTVDNTNVTITGSRNGIIGTMSSAGVGQSRLTRVNFDDIIVRDCRSINTPAATSNGYGVIAVDLTSNIQTAAQEGANTYSITNVTVDNVYSDGGTSNINVMYQQMAGSSGQSGPGFLDNVNVSNSYCSMGASITTATGANIQVGGIGFGERCRVRNNHCLLGNDSAIEIDGMMDAITEDNVIEDHRNEAVLFTNFSTPRDVTRQTNRSIRDRIRFNTVTPDDGTNYPAQGVRFGANTNGPGVCIVRDLSLESAVADKLYTTGRGVYIPSTSANTNTVIIDGVTSRRSSTAPTNTGASTVMNALVDIRPTQSCRVKISNVDEIISGTAGTLNHVNEIGAVHIGNSSGTTVTLDIDRVRADYGGIGGTTTNILTFYVGLALSNAANIQGVVRRLLTGATVGGSGQAGVWMGSALAITNRLRFVDFDFTGHSGAISEILDSGSHGGAYYIERLILHTGQGPYINWTPSGASAPSIGASPGVWTNTTGLRGFVAVTGGTVSLVEAGKLNSSSVMTYNTVGTGDGWYWVENNDNLRITYSSVPTLAFYPSK